MIHWAANMYPCLGELLLVISRLSSRPRLMSLRPTDAVNSVLRVVQGTPGQKRKRHWDPNLLRQTLIDLRKENSMHW